MKTFEIHYFDRKTNQTVEKDFKDRELAKVWANDNRIGKSPITFIDNETESRGRDGENELICTVREITNEDKLLKCVYVMIDKFKTLRKSADGDKNRTAISVADKANEYMLEDEESYAKLQESLQDYKAACAKFSAFEVVVTWMEKDIETYKRKRYR